MPMPDTDEDSPGTTDTLEYVSREGPVRPLYSLRTRRLRAPTATRAYRTFTLERGVEILSWVSMTPGGGRTRPAFHS